MSDDTSAECEIPQESDEEPRPALPRGAALSVLVFRTLEEDDEA
jgi:hypothetical protein